MSFLGANIKFLRKQKGFTQVKLAEKLGVARALIGAYEEERSEPRLATLRHMAHVFGVSLDALIASDISSSGNISSQEISGQKLRVLPVAIKDGGDEELATLVPVKASAGYLNGYGDLEYIEQLPHFSLPFPELSGEGTYRVFQIQGDSMLPMPSGAYVVCKYVQDWRDVKNDQCYVVITQSEGVVYKRVINELHEGSLLLKSDNTQYSPYRVGVEDIVEVWKAMGFVSFQLPNEGTSMQISDVAEALMELKREVNALKDKINS